MVAGYIRDLLKKYNKIFALTARTYSDWNVTLFAKFIFMAGIRDRYDRNCVTSCDKFFIVTRENDL